MVRFIEIENSGEDKENSRIAIDSIADYRAFKNDDKMDKTIIFFKQAEKKKSRVIDVSVKEIDKICGVYVLD
tara:strand:- start:632 stop:847 length:216 start_codon:yes stop_codon:yes gene_type:complete